MSPSVSPENTRTTFVNGKRIYLVKVANAQRVLIYLVLGMILVNCGGPLAMQSFSGGAPLGLAPFAVLGVVQLAIALCAIVQTVRMSIAAGSNPIIAGVCGAFMIVPLLGLILLLLANIRASALLRANGVRVGLLGVPPAEMQKLVIGACPSCGYDIRGLLSPQCPECGTVLPDRDAFRPAYPAPGAPA